MCSSVGCLVRLIHTLGEQTVCLIDWCVCMYVCMCVHMCVHVCVYVCAYVCACICVGCGGGGFESETWHTLD